MPKVKDFEGISAMLRDEKKQNIFLLHKFVFEEEGDRKNKKRLREFQGYKYCITNQTDFIPKKQNKSIRTQRCSA